ANLADCIIRVAYRTSHGSDRILEATFDPKSDYVAKVYTPEGEFLDVADVEASGDYPLRLFGWSEIETIGRRPARQRDLLDRLISGIEPILRKRADLRRELHDSTATVMKAIRNVKSAFDKSDGEIRRYKEYTGDFEKLNTDEVKGLFATLDLAQAKQALLKKVRANAERLTEKLGDPTQLSLRGDLDAVLEAGVQSLRDWWLGHEIPQLGLLSAEQDVQKALREAIERVRSFVTLVDQHIASLSDQTKEVEQKLRAEFSGDTSKQRVADLRANAKRRCEHATGLRANYLKSWDELDKALTDRDAILEAVVEV